MLISNSGRRYVMLKIFIQASSLGQHVENELKMYRRIEQSQSSKDHPGRKSLRTLLDTFDIDGPSDKHRCLVHPPLWDSVLTLLRRNPVERLPPAILVVVLHGLFLALDYLHTKCKVVHTDLCLPTLLSTRCPYCYSFNLPLLSLLDIKADNIMLGINDDSVFTDFEEKELQRPVPRKEIITDTDKRTIYVSRDLRIPKDFSAPVLCDFGSAVPGDQYRSDLVQPNIYRAPEVILEAPWTYSIDIWNVGCMV